MKTKLWRGGVLAVFCGIAIAAVSIPATPLGIRVAQAQTIEDFQAALEPYGEWRQHPRWGDIWVPFDRPRGWRPYTVGHWVYTDEWGWFWVSDDDEEDWGWIPYHYGRWMFERGIGWFWLPGEDWAPAWVDWRYSDDAVGWAPLPPEDVIYEFDEEPGYWVFVSPRYMLAPRWRTYMIPIERRAVVFRATRLVNRTVPLQGRRVAVNPGIAPAHIAAVTRTSVPTFRVSPRVFAATAGVAGAVAVTAAQVRAGRQPGGPGRPRTVSVQQTPTVIQPSNNAAPRALGQGERGHFGPRAPRAAQGTTIQQQPQTQQQQPQIRQQQPQTQQQSPQQPQQPVQPQQRQIQQAPAQSQPTQQQPAQSQPAPRREFREQRPEVRPSGEQPVIVRPGEPAKPQRPMIDQTPPRQQTPARQERVQQPGIVRPQPESRPVQQPQQPQQQAPQQPRVQQPQQPQQPRPVQQQAPAKPAQPAAQPAKPAAKPDEKKKPEEKK
jgi:hypothetical protein